MSFVNLSSKEIRFLPRYYVEESEKIGWDSKIYTNISYRFFIEVKDKETIKIISKEIKKIIEDTDIQSSNPNKECNSKSLINLIWENDQHTCRFVTPYFVKITKNLISQFASFGITNVRKNEKVLFYFFSRDTMDTDLNHSKINNRLSSLEYYFKMIFSFVYGKKIDNFSFDIVEKSNKKEVIGYLYQEHKFSI